MPMELTLPDLTRAMASDAQKNICLQQEAAGREPGRGVDRRRRYKGAALLKELLLPAEHPAGTELVNHVHAAWPGPSSAPHGQRDRVGEASVGQDVFVVHDDSAAEPNPYCNVSVSGDNSRHNALLLRHGALQASERPCISPKWVSGWGTSGAVQMQQG